jgi:hypothetical protein
MPWGFAAAGVASGVAGAAANSAGGKKGSDESRQSSALSHEQATNARVQRQLGIQQFSATQGLRNDTIKNLGLAANGGIPSFLDLAPKVDSSLSAFTPTSHLATLSIPQIEYDHAQNKQALLRSGVRGGALTQGLGQAAMQSGVQRANALQQLQLGDLSRLEGFKTDDIMRQQGRDEQRARIRQTLFGAASD